MQCSAQGGAPLVLTWIELPKEGLKVLADDAVEDPMLRRATHVRAGSRIGRSCGVKLHDDAAPPRLVPWLATADSTHFKETAVKRSGERRRNRGCRQLRSPPLIALAHRRLLRSRAWLPMHNAHARGLHQSSPSPGHVSRVEPSIRIHRVSERSSDRYLSAQSLVNRANRGAPATVRFPPPPPISTRDHFALISGGKITGKNLL